MIMLEIGNLETRDRQGHDSHQSLLINIRNLGTRCSHTRSFRNLYYHLQEAAEAFATIPAM
jgi:hypothetical protein